MNNVQKLKLNSFSSLLNRAIIIISGFILPRLYLVYYGPEIHGLTQSINQFLNIIIFLDLGVGAVVQSALYKPLAQKDSLEISRILKSANNYFRKIAFLLVVYVILLAIFYPYILDSSFDRLSTVTLIISMSFSIFAQYYFGIVNELLLTADQKSYVQLFSEIGVVVLTTIALMILIPRGYSIQFVKLVSALIYLIRPVFLNYYVSKNYDLDKNIKLTSEPIKQKWNGLAQHLSYTVTNNTDLVTLSIFSTMEHVSIYSIYNMPIRGIRLLINSLAGGLRPFFGNLIAEDKIEELTSYFSQIEWMLHTAVILLFSTTAVLILPFVNIYTTGIESVDYIQPLFALVFILSQSILAIRIPYQNVTLAAGHYKQTQTSSMIEAGLNIILSLILVHRFDLVGVAFASLISLTYRTLYLVNYLSKNILYRSQKHFTKHLTVDIIIFLIILILGIIFRPNPQTVVSWLVVAAVVFVINTGISLLVNYIFYPEFIRAFFKRLGRRFK